MLGTSVRAYGNYLFGGGKSLDEKSISLRDLPQFQGMSKIADSNNGQLLYKDYPENQDNRQFRQTIGRTGVGGVTRDKNTYSISDRYTFNSKDNPNNNRLTPIGESILAGDTLAALSHTSSLVGNDFDSRIKIPVPLAQQQSEGRQLPYSANNTTIGNQQYKWEAYQLKDGEAWEDVARKSFAGNMYKPEGDNLVNYSNMIIKQNQGNNSNIIYRPVPVDNSNVGDSNIVQKALSLAKRFIQ